MTMEELVQEIMKHSDEYAVDSVESIAVGAEPIRKHKKRRIQKKWLKRYGMKATIEYKKCKKLDVTLDLIVDFCSKYGYPLPVEMLTEQGE